MEQHVKILGLLYFKPWARVLTIILSVIHLFSVPLGTALGFLRPVGAVAAGHGAAVQSGE